MRPSSGDPAVGPAVSNVVCGEVSGLVVQAGEAEITVQAPTAGKVQSRYRQFVLQRIAPAELLQRDDELRQLAEFCTAPEVVSCYRWVRAEAWSGKSALMSWFALNPPVGVRIVSFFVTARLANQNDRAAFADNVMQQLLELLDGELPALMTDTTRESHLTGLIDDAAEHCQERGKRLVLLVDGLDEDRGAETHSIAGLLPASPLAGMRVLVAGRPNPPIPSDVASNHPLRDPAIVVALARSPHADTARAQMERELKALYRGTPAEQDLLGLVTTAGGGLGAADLAELTGGNEWDVEDLLTTVAGRSFTRRETERHPVYLLGHEELQVAARGMFGARRLDDYRGRLHHWADGYRSDRWPERTPAYLLQGYFNMLAAVGDVARMVECATDPQRQDRMLDVFGGDALALEELSAAYRAVAARMPPDLSTLTRLAIHRDVLLGRNSNIPANLPELWAVLGYLGRAESIAYSVSTGRQRARALTRLARVLFGAEISARTDEILASARDAVRAVSDPDERARLLAMLSGWNLHYDDALTLSNALTVGVIHACCAAGAYDSASRVAAGVTNSAERSVVVSTAVRTLLDELRLEMAAGQTRLEPFEWFPDTEILWSEELPIAGRPEIGELADGLVRLADEDPVRAAILQAELRMLPGLLNVAEPSTSVVRACIALGEVDKAERVLRRLEERSRARFDVLRHVDVLDSVTRAGVRTGRMDIARAVLAQAGIDGYKAMVHLGAAMAEASDQDSLHFSPVIGVVRGALEADELRQLLTSARELPQTELRVRALTGVLRYTIDVGDLTSAANLLEWASALAACVRPRGQAVDMSLDTENVCISSDVTCVSILL